MVEVLKYITLFLIGSGIASSILGIFYDEWLRIAILELILCAMLFLLILIIV